jgi:hypothetical protein
MCSVQSVHYQSLASAKGEQVAAAADCSRKHYFNLLLEQEHFKAESCLTFSGIDFRITFSMHSNKILIIRTTEKR